MKRVWSINLCLGVLAAASFASAAEQPAASQPTTLQEQKQRADELAAVIKAKPFSGELNLEQALQIRQEGSALVVGTNIVATPKPRAFVMHDHGLCTAMLRMNRYGMPMLVQFEKLDTSDPHATYIDTSLNAFPGRFMLSMERATPLSVDFIQLLDDRTDQRVNGGSGGQCNLYIQVNDPDDHQLANLQFGAADFKTLVGEHRSTIDIYLRPAFRELGQEKVLLPDEAEARQVLTASQPVADPKLDEKIDQYVAKLDSPNLADRLAAMQSLRQLGTPAIQSLQSMKRRQLTVEQCNRLDDVIGSIWPLQQADAQRIGGDLAFVIDCLDLPDADLRKLAAERLEKLTGQMPPAQLTSKDALVRRQAVDDLRHEWLTPGADLRATTQPAAQETNPLRDSGVP